MDSELDRLRRELGRLRVENVRLSRLLDLRGQDKLALNTDRFRARTDTYAMRWDNARTGASGWMPAVAGGRRKGTDRKAASYLPLTAEVVSTHLIGDVFIGLYPLLT